MQETWDIQNPAKVTLPSSNAAFCYDVKCIAAIGNNEIWVGAGPSIFFLDEQTLERCVRFSFSLAPFSKEQDSTCSSAYTRHGLECFFYLFTIFNMY